MSKMYKLSEPQNHRCCYCGHTMIRHSHRDGRSTPRNAMTRDHILPETYGGTTGFFNLVAACCQCNNLRGEMEAVAFFNLLQKWFKRDRTLRERWHTLSREQLGELKRHCIDAHERYLRGLARRDVECAFRHHALIIEHWWLYRRA